MPQNFYSTQIEKLNILIRKSKKKQKIIYWLRAIVFISGTYTTILAFNKLDNYYGYFFMLFSIIILLFLSKITQNINKKIYFLEILKNQSENEKKAINYDFSNFDTGEEYIDTKHNFSYDLDIFGESSIFQILNRANTKKGKDKLANLLQNPYLEKTKIIKNQQAIKELKNKPDFVQLFFAQSKLAQQAENKTEYKANFNNPTALEGKFSKKIWKFLLITLPIIYFLLPIVIVLLGLPKNIIVLYTIIMYSISGIYIKYINKIHNELSKQDKIFKAYSEIIELLEKQDFKSEHLKSLQKKLYSKGKKASKVIKKYSNLLKALDGRLNILFFLIAEPILLWDIQIIRRIEIITKQHIHKFEEWIATIAEFETLASMSTFAFNNPHYTFPQISETNFLEAVSIGHPLIKPQKLISNDFKIDKETKAFIITGANMAGKSTFIRTIGVNFILAMTGSVVCAAKMIFKPVSLMSSIRITDSISSEESYFYAELKRLQKIIQTIQKGQTSLIIIDEMLRGTNSIDKHKGSEGLLKKLINYETITFLATHDVELGKLENSFPKKITNYCFEAQLKNDELKFDYKIQKGISKNLNASFLMKKMGIIE